MSEVRSRLEAHRNDALVLPLRPLAGVENYRGALVPAALSVNP